MATTMEAAKAGEILKAALAGHVGSGGGDLTIADAAAKAGVSLREAELGLHWLSSQYRGTLSATEKGELLFRFPYGFSLPFTKRPGVLRFFDKLKRGVLGVGKLVVRAWITVVLVGYVAAFLAVLLALMFGGGRDRDSGSSGGGGGLAYALIRVLSEALWWTFHPFSPVARRNVYDGSLFEPQVSRRSRRAVHEEKSPFYERVNRFVFGPEPERVDERELERRLLQQIRAGQGRIGIADVLRVTGLPREEADPLLARLMLDYDGEVEVSDDGGIFYKFPALRRTAQETAFDRPPPPVWNERKQPAPVTGNDSGSNLLIAALNGFNLLMSFVALSTNMTIDRLMYLFSTAKMIDPPPFPAWDGLPLVLGAIPLVFSSLLFLLPMVRALLSRRRERQAAAENGRRAVLKTVLETTHQGGKVTEEQLQQAWQQAAGREVDLEELRKQVLDLGGDVAPAAMERGAESAEKTELVFRDLEAELKALRSERAEAKDDEKSVGAVVFRA